VYKVRRQETSRRSVRLWFIATIIEQPAITKILDSLGLA